MQFYTESFLPLSYFQDFQAYQAPILETPANIRKAKRCWNKAKVEALYTAAKCYCALSNKSLESLTLSDFSVISSYVQESPLKCMKKIKEICISGSLASGTWSLAEDEMLINLINSKVKKWGIISEKINTTFHDSIKIRSGKQCKERWVNHLDPAMKRDKWTAEEDIAALRLFQKHGKKWSKISKIFGNRTDSSIKNRVKSLLNKHKQELDSTSNGQLNVELLIEKIQKNTHKKVD